MEDKDFLEELDLDLELPEGSTFDPEDTQEFNLDDILREFGSGETPQIQVEEPPVEEIALQEPVVMEEPAVEEAPADVPVVVEEPVVEEAPAEMPVVEEPEASAEEKTEEAPVVEEPAAPVSGDTIRLDTGKVRKAARKVKGAVPILEEPETKEPFSEQWEPEYEQPMGEYVPPQPIAFPSRSRLRELKRKLVAGPEKRYYELLEKGLGKLQICIFLSLVVMALSAGATVMYGMGMVQEDRMKLMVFGQLFAMLFAALFASSQLVEGITDLLKKRFTFKTLLVFTFIVCCVDGLLCLKQLRVPCCAAFSLQSTMALWSSYQRRHGEMGQMDTLRKAHQLEGVVIAEDYYNGRKALLRTEGDVDHFMENYRSIPVPEKVLCWYAFVALLASLGIGAAAYVFHQSVSVAIQVTAVSLMASAPATAFIAMTRPLALLQKRLHTAGAVICGWQGAVRLRKRAVFPVEYRDLIPEGAARMNGVKFFGSRPTDEVLSYCTAVVVANGSGLAPVFTQVLESRNGYHYDAENLQYYDGGIGGEVEGENVLVGSMAFLKNMGVEIPDGLRVNQAVCVAIEGELCGLFALTYENARNAATGLATLCSARGARPIFITDDFLLNETFIRSRFGVNTRRMHFVSWEQRQELRQKQAEEGQTAVMLVTRDSLAAYARGIVGAKALRSACNVGLIVNMLCGIVGIGIMVTLLLLGALHLLTPAHVFLYQLVWVLPGLLVTEWTRAI